MGEKICLNFFSYFRKFDNRVGKMSEIIAYRVICKCENIEYIDESKLTLSARKKLFMKFPGFEEEQVKRRPLF